MSAITSLEWLVATDIIGRSMLVGQRPMKSLLRLSVRSSSFLKIGSLVFSDIVHVDGWPWYLVIDVASFLKKYFGGPNLGPMGLNQAQNEVLRHFIEFGSYFFLEIAYSDSLCVSVKHLVEVKPWKIF